MPDHELPKNTQPDDTQPDDKRTDAGSPQDRSPGGSNGAANGGPKAAPSSGGADGPGDPAGSGGANAGATPPPRKRLSFSRRYKRWVQRHQARLMATGFIVTFLVLYFWPIIFITIFPGQHGVLFKRFWGGVVENKVYEEGLHIISPWNDLIPYNTRVQQLSVNASALTTNGLVVTLQASVRYYPDIDRLPLLHKNVGPAYRDTIILPVAQSSLRKVVGKYSPEEIYSTETQLIQEEVMLEMISQTGRLPIVYDALLIEAITLPEIVRNSIENKLKAQQEFFTYEFRLKEEAEEIKRKVLEAEGIRAFNAIVSSALSDKLLTWLGVKASLELAKSTNSKVVLFGGGDKGLPVILNLDGVPAMEASANATAMVDMPIDSHLIRPENATDSAENATTPSVQEIVKALRAKEDRLQDVMKEIPQLQKLLDDFDIKELDIYAPSAKTGR